MNFAVEGWCARMSITLRPSCFAAAGRDLVPQHRLLAEIMHERRKDEFRIFGIAHGPPGEASRHRNHVGLRIAALHPQRMKLHDFAAVVLIESMRQRAASRSE